MISLLNRTEASEGILSGIVTTVLSIDCELKWVDTSDMKEDTEDQISKVSIPENLHPNSATFFFELQTVDHRLYFQTYSSGKVLTTKQALSLFLGLADDLSIRQKYGHVKITVVQSRAGLNALFKLPVIKEIKITIKKPNADIFADDFEEQDRKSTRLNSSH